MVALLDFFLALQLTIVSLDVEMFKVINMCVYKLYCADSNMDPCPIPLIIDKWILPIYCDVLLKFVTTSVMCVLKVLRLTSTCSPCSTNS